MVERTRLLGMAGAIRRRAGHCTQHHSMMPGDGRPRRRLGSAVRLRHEVEGRCDHPNGGEVALRRLVGNAGALRDARAMERTRHESGDDRRAELATARPERTSDDTRPTAAALITDILSTPAMITPLKCLRALARRSVCFRIAAVRNAVVASIVGSWMPIPDRTRRPSRSTSNAQAKTAVLTPPMSVKQNFFSDRARRNSVRHLKKHKQRSSAMAFARTAAARAMQYRSPCRDYYE